MKKSFPFALFVLVLGLCANAQTYDTVTGPGGRLPGYHYSYWYDTCWHYFDTLWPHPYVFQVRRMSVSSDFERYVKGECTDHPIAITGFGVWQADPNNPGCEPPGYVIPNAERVPEYVFVHKHDRIRDTIVYIDSARWDTAAPKVLKLPRHADTNRFGFNYCFLHEVHLSKPIIVDSVFYLSGSFHNNVQQFNSYFHIPSVYAAEQISLSGHQCLAPVFDHSYTIPYRLWRYNFNRDVWTVYGFYMAMVDYVNVNTQSSDTCMGSAYPSGQLSQHVHQTLHAVRKPGYVFSHWVDGVVSPQVVSYDNPRSVLLTQDSTFTAVFRPSRRYHVEGRTHNPDRGAVFGSGDFFEGDTITLHAVPNSGFAFAYWSNGSTRNPAHIVVDRDTLLSAVFRRCEVLRVDALTSDHSRGYVSGGGYYNEFDVATLRASPQLNYVFHHWNDSCTDNPRSFSVTQDTAFTAFFVSLDAIGNVDEASSFFSLSPNPARSVVNVSVSLQAAPLSQCRLAVVDASGLERLSLPLNGPDTSIPLDNLSPGTYFVVLHSPKGSFTQRLVVN